MRKLITSDLFGALRVVKASGAREALKPVAAKVASGSRDVRAIGIDAIFAVLESCADSGTEEAFYSFLAPIWEMDEKAVASLPIDDMMANMEEMASENDLAAFFRRLSGLIAQRN